MLKRYEDWQGPPSGFRNKEESAFISWEQISNFKGTREHRQYWGSGNNFSNFGEPGNRLIYSRGTREQVLPLWGPDCLQDRALTSTGKGYIPLVRLQNLVHKLLFYQTLF